MKLSDFNFGFADAEKELLYLPQIFTDAFVDSKNIISRLLDTPKYMLVGRKGVGKSAYSARIQTLAKTSNYFVKPIKLNDFEYGTFSKASISDDLIGTQKYKNTWDFLYIITIIKTLYNDLHITENEKLVNVFDLLEKLGFILTENHSSDVRKLSKLKAGINLSLFDITYEKEFGEKPLDFNERITQIRDLMLSALNDVYLDKKILLIIDGVDDILRLKKKQLEILSSMIRSIDYLNTEFKRSNINVKILLFIRDDIMNNVTDPDFNKIKRDGSIRLSWQDAIDDLHRIIELRFQLSNKAKQTSQKQNIWYSIFPAKIRKKDSWSYVLEYTLYKPRDILQFLVSCQEEYPNKESLTFSEISLALKQYSQNYFIEEMKNELAGFVKDSYINIIFQILLKLGDNKFTYERFSTLISEEISSKEYNIDEVKTMLTLLYNAGYVGQLLEIENKDGELNKSVVFKHRNPQAQIDFSQYFITHKGLHAGLGIKI